MNHTQSCPISIADSGAWYSTQKPFCNCLKSTGANPLVPNATLAGIPYTCTHDWRSSKTSEGMLTCSKCSQMENVSQDVVGALTPLGLTKVKELVDFSGSIYKHIVYNPHMRNIDAVINQAQEDGKDWQFSHAQPVTEYECVAVFEKWIF